MVWGNVGERDSAKETGLPALLKETAWLLYELLFLWACTCVCVFQLVRRYVHVCLCVCLHVCVEGNVCKRVLYAYSAVAYITHACIPHLSTRHAHWDKTGPVIVSVFLPAFSAISSPSEALLTLR